MMARFPHFFFFLDTALLLWCCFTTIAGQTQQNPASSSGGLIDHGGALLTGNITVRLFLYGAIAANRRAAINDFLLSLSTGGSADIPSPSVASWWASTAGYFPLGPPPTIILGPTTVDHNYSLGKYLTAAKITELASLGPHRNSLTIVLTDENVTADGFCVSQCGYHASAPVTPNKKNSIQFPYIWIGDCSIQCPGFCAWPFYLPPYGPKTTPLKPPNGDVGSDGIVINLATLLADAVTNPYGNGYFQGPAEAPLEAVTACAGTFGPGSYPGYPGNLLIDNATGASYNVYGIGGRKFLLPAIWDPKTSKCASIV